MCPSNGPMNRHALSSTGSARLRSPASPVLWRAPTSAVSSAGAPFSSHPPYHRVPALRSHCRQTLRPWAKGFVYPDSLTDRNHRWKTADLPGSWGALMRACPALRPRRNSGGLAITSVSVLPSVVSKTSAPAKRSFRGSITRPTRSLSTLRSDGYPATTQDSLPAAGQALPGGILTR